MVAHPTWTDILTAIGTVATAIAAVGIAIWSDWRIARRVADERAYQQQQLQAERDRSNRELAEERARSAAELARERLRAHELEQLAEARAVQVFAGKTDDPDSKDGSGHAQVQRLIAIVVNGGTYTITRVEVQFSLNGTSMVTHHGRRRVEGYPDAPPEVRRELGTPLDLTRQGSTLTPIDTGLRFETDGIHVRHLTMPHPVARWTDRWGKRWEHALGDAHEAPDDSW